MIDHAVDIQTSLLLTLTYKSDRTWSGWNSILITASQIKLPNQVYHGKQITYLCHLSILRTAKHDTGIHTQSTYPVWAIQPTMC